MRSPAAPFLRRIVAGGIAASLAILLLAACSPNAGISPPPASKGAAKETVAPGPNGAAGRSSASSGAAAPPGDPVGTAAGERSAPPSSGNGPAAAAPDRSADPPTENPAGTPAGTPAGAAASRVPYDGPIEHLFFHPLIVYPERAFTGDRLAKGYDDYFVTVPEFKKILASLYERGYLLVDIFDVLDVREDGTVARKTLRLPEGKKPLILSVDDLNYYPYMVRRGNAVRLVLDEEGNVAAASIDRDGRPVVSRDDEIVPIVDRFVSEHPDFSLDGAKGILNLTGYEGILGYRTQNPARPEAEAERQAALRVVERLKATGWRFASHSYGHPDVAKISLERLKEDTRKWKTEVEPLVGPTPLYVYPFGSHVPPSDAKFRWLQSQGFHVFFGVGPKPYLRMEQDWAFMDRRHIDGIALKTQKDLLRPLFDADAVLDPARPR
ncbi:MAG: hypothetical protein KM312_08655 [Hydrogenibacillus schlegelii]|uniref:NodB homology domain-containing protein n=1 Tax=Hydrogenibacillus schlegelii TaxID=1484 RepID=A0A947D275_HYDSH|nr:hypothetical protein [Hydrogenibacillus schlegelii]